MKGEGKSDMKSDMKCGLKSEARGGSGLSEAHTLESTGLGPNSSTSSTSHTLQTCTSSASTEGLTSSATYTFTSSSTSTTTTSTSSTSSSCALSGVGGDEGLMKAATPSLPTPLPLSTAAAAIASFSSTTGWIRDEVRRRGQPATAQAMTSPPPSTSLSIGSVLLPHSKSDILKVASLIEGTKAGTEAECTAAGEAVVGDGMNADESNDMNGKNDNTMNKKHVNVLQKEKHTDEVKKNEKHEKHEKGVLNHVEVGKEGSVSGTSEHTFFHSFLQNGSIPHFLNRKSHSQSHSQSQSSSQHLSALSPESHSPDSNRIKAFSLISDLKAQSLESLADTLLGPRSDSGVVKNTASAAENSHNGSLSNNHTTNGHNNDHNNGNSYGAHHNNDNNNNNDDNNDNIKKNDHNNNNNNNFDNNTALSSSNSPPLEIQTISIKKCNGSNTVTVLEESVALQVLSGNAGTEECTLLSPLPMPVPMSLPMSLPMPMTPSAFDSAPPNPFLSSPSMITHTPTHTHSHTPVLTPPGTRTPGPTPYTALSYDSDTATISLPLPLTLSTPSHDTRDILLTPSSSPPTVLTPVSALSTPPSLPKEMSASNDKAQQQQQQQQQQQRVVEREEKTHPGKEKDKHLEKSEWFNKLGEAKEKLQNKFSVFKSKLVHLPGTALSPSTHINIPNTSLSDILLPKLADAAVISVKPATARTNSTADPQQPVTYKSALPELLISSMSSLTSPSPSPSHHSASKVPWVSTGISTSTTHVMGSLIENSTAAGGVGEVGVGEGGNFPRKNMSSFSPLPKPISDPILRARSTSDASSHSMRPESDPLGRSRRALSVGTFESAFSARKASELSHSAKSKNLYTKGSFKATLKATTTPQERRYNMYKHFEMSFADRETEEGLDELITPTPFNAVSKFGMLSSDAKLISLCGSEMSPNAAVMMYEQQLTNTERSESSFSPGDHSAPALSRMGVLWAPPSTERMWAELSIGGKFGKASLQLYFVGDKSSQGVDVDESRKTVSFVDHTDVDRASAGTFNGSTGTGSSSSSSQSNNCNSSIAPGAGAGAGVQASKMVLAASYDLQEAECRQLPRPQSTEMVSGQAEGSESSEPHTAAAAGFEILLHTDRKKWIAFMCPLEEDCDDWMDAIDNVAHV